MIRETPTNSGPKKDFITKVKISTNSLPMSRNTSRQT